MSTRLFLLLSFIFSFIQASFLPAVFFEGLLIVFLLISRTSLRVFPALFLGGLLFDLIQFQTLGITSIIFLLIGFFLRTLKERVSLQKPIILVGLALVINITRSQIVFETINLGNLIIVGIISYFLFKFIWIPDRG